MKFKTAIIDLDPIVYKCAFSIQKYDKEDDIIYLEPLKKALYNANSMVKKILRNTQADDHIGYLTSTDHSNFRFKLCPEYKANRKSMVRPVYYNQVREHLLRKFNAGMVCDQEADDACSIMQYTLNNLGFNCEITNSILCSIDKDFNNIPGWHYNYDKEEVYYVNETEAKRNFYLQILAGDKSDNIPRIKKGWRQKETEEKLEKAENEAEMIDIIKNEVYKVLYEPRDNSSLTESQVEQDINREIQFRGRLVHLRTKEEELWVIPTIIP